MTWHRWTEDERDFVRLNYKQDNESKRYIANRLGVSYHAVSGQVAKMGLAKRSGRKSWDEKQDDQLQELIFKHSASRVAVIMNRSENSIVVRSKRLGLHRRFRDGWYTKTEACEILGVDHKRVQSWIDCGALYAEYHNGHKPQKNGMSMWHIPEKSIYNFLRKCPQELNGRNCDIIQIVEILAGLSI